MAAAGARQAAMAPDGADSMKADVCGSSAMARRSSALYSISSWLRSTGFEGRALEGRLRRASRRKEGRPQVEVSRDAIASLWFL